MSSSFTSNIRLNLKLFASGVRFNQRFYTVSRSGLPTFDSGSGHDKYSSRKLIQIQTQQRRDLSLENIREINVRMYNYVNSTDLSIQLKNALINVHDITGLPWWATIVVTGFSVKFLLSLTSGVYQQYLGARLYQTKEDHKKALVALLPELTLRAKRGKWGETRKKIEFMREAKRMWTKMVIKNNCHPMKIILLIWMQFPVWLFISYTLRGLVDVDNAAFSVPFHTQLELQKEGIFWWRNLLTPDGTLILPTILFLSSWLIVDINAHSSPLAATKKKYIMNLIFKTIAVLSFIVSASIPSCISLYWTTSILFGLGQNLLLMSPRVKRFCRIPKTAQEIARPYTHLITNLKTTYFTLPKFLKSSKYAKEEVERVWEEFSSFPVHQWTNFHIIIVIGFIFSRLKQAVFAFKSD